MKWPRPLEKTDEIRQVHHVPLIFPSSQRTTHEPQGAQSHSLCTVTRMEGHSETYYGWLNVSSQDHGEREPQPRKIHTLRHTLSRNICWDLHCVEHKAKEKASAKRPNNEAGLSAKPQRWERRKVKARTCKRRAGLVNSLGFQMRSLKAKT